MEDGAVGVAVETGPASVVDPAANVVGAMRDGAGSIGAVRDGAVVIGAVRDDAVVIGAVDPLESAGGGGGSDMIGTWSLITKLVGLGFLPALLLRL